MPKEPSASAVGSSPAMPIDASPVVPLRIGSRTWYCFCVREHSAHEGHTSAEHLALVHSPKEPLISSSHAVFCDAGPVHVRVHSECLFGDVFGAESCDCGDQLAQAIEMIGVSDGGVIVYLRQEGRGIGLFNKIRTLTIANPDSFARNEAIGLPADDRRYYLAGRLLRGLGVRSARLMSGNPAKLAALQSVGIETTPIPCHVAPRLSKEAYSDVLAKLRRGYSYWLPDTSSVRR